MKCLAVVAILATVFLYPACASSAAETGNGATEERPAVQTCTGCHKDGVTPSKKDHRKVAARSIEDCLTCHKPAVKDYPDVNRFGSSIHRAHVNKATTVACLSCHSWSAEKGFGPAAGGRDGISYGPLSRSDLHLLRRVFASWSDSPYLDAIHGRGNVSCLACHGSKAPAMHAVADSRNCVACHGRLECLAEKTTPADFPERNPHSSHLGHTACTDCHKAHQSSGAVCLNCHKNFRMKMPGEVLP